MVKTGTAIIFMFVAVVVLIGIVGYVAFKPTAQEIITPSGQTITGESCAATEQAKGMLGRAATVNAKAYDGAPDNINTQRASTLYMWDVKDPSVLVADATTLSASASTSVSGFTRGSVVGGVSFDSTYYGVPITETCINDDTVNLNFRVFTKTDAIKTTFKGNDSVTGAIVSFAGVAASETVDEIHFLQNQSDKAYRFAGFYIDLVPSSNVSTVTLSSGDFEWSDTAARQTVGLSSPTSVAFTKVTSPFLSNTRRETANVVFTTTPILLLENDEVVAKSLIVSLDSDRCGTAENLVFYPFDQAYSRSESGKGVILGYETDAVSPADAGVSDTGASFYGTLACTAS